MNDENPTSTTAPEQDSVSQDNTPAPLELVSMGMLLPPIGHPERHVAFVGNMLSAAPDLGLDMRGFIDEMICAATQGLLFHTEDMAATAKHVEEIVSQVREHADELLVYIKEAEARQLDEAVQADPAKAN